MGHRGPKCCTSYKVQNYGHCCVKIPEKMQRINLTNKVGNRARFTCLFVCWLVFSHTALWKIQLWWMTVGALAAGVTMVAHIPVLIGTTQVLLSFCLTHYCSYVYITCISFKLHCEHLRPVYIFKYPGFYLNKKRFIVFLHNFNSKTLLCQGSHSLQESLKFWGILNLEFHLPLKSLKISVQVLKKSFWMFANFGL